MQIKAGLCSEGVLILICTICIKELKLKIKPRF